MFFEKSMRLLDRKAGGLIILCCAYFYQVSKTENDFSTPDVANFQGGLISVSKLLLFQCSNTVTCIFIETLFYFSFLDYLDGEIKFKFII